MFIQTIMDVNSTTLLMLFGTGTALFAYYSYKCYLLHKKYEHIPGPAISSLFELYFGNIADFADVIKGAKIFPEQLYSWKEKYGPIFRINLAGRFVVVLSNPNHIREALIDNDFEKNKREYKQLGYPFDCRYLGQGLVTEVDKAAWRSKRALLNNIFHRSNLLSYLKDFNDQGNILMERLRSLADGRTIIALFPELSHATLDVIANIAFGLNTNSINDPNCKLNAYISKSLEGMNSYLLDPFYTLKPTKFFEIRQYKKTISDLRDFARAKIKEKIQEMESDGFTNNDMLSTILKHAQNEGESLDLETLVDHFITFFIAGQETSANTLAFAIMELGLNKDVHETLKKEVDLVLGEKPNLDFDDLNKLEYTGCVIKESLRKWTPVAAMSRQTSEDFYLDGHFLPKNTWIMVSPYLSGRNPENFPEPDKFKPERFMKDSAFSKINNVSSYTFFPFSLGPRNCIGQNFAMIETKVLLAKFVQNFDFELDPTQSFRPFEQITLRPKDGCRLFLRLRAH